MVRYNEILKFIYLSVVGGFDEIAKSLTIQGSGNSHNRPRSNLWLVSILFTMNQIKQLSSRQLIQPDETYCNKF